ncbi:MAG: FlaA1/EpsC-like NDP-sugar epimerase [Gammaproteobacteria bacterium]|jgi:FlaA1/EpsC-like NDP-sugar epimerase
MYRELIYWLLRRNRSTKRSMLVVIDFLVIPLTLWAAFSIRLEVLYIPPLFQYWIFLVAPLIAIPIFVRFGLYRAIVRYIGFKALWAVVTAVFLYTLVWSLLVLLTGVSKVPVSVHLLCFLMTVFSVGGSRIAARWIFNRSRSKQQVVSESVSNVVIYGAGSAGRQLAAALSLGTELTPVAFIDDDKSMQHFLVQGLKVYPFSRLSFLVENFQVNEVLLALPSISRARRNEIILMLEPYSLHVKTIPGVSELAQGKAGAEDVRDVDIIDLLGRDTVEPNIQLLNANILDKVVMVTGAGGSIGSELCRQIATHNPKRLVLFENSEFQLYSIEKELRRLRLDAPIEILPILGSVADKRRMESVCSVLRVQTIYHAAAYKHVPLVERNPGEAIQNNIFGTLIASQAAINAGVETFVLISTDKAVRPTNTMGATKRFAELILQGLSENKHLCKNTRFTMVRFGNVLGSSGSVVPLFREQIAQGGPVTVTDKRIIRYFMTIPEAAELVIQAGAMGQGGDVFVLDMGEPVHIVDLARRLIRLSGLDIKDESSPYGDIEISFTGLRPGEKLYEELLIGENVDITEHEKIMRAEEEVIPWEVLLKLLAELREAMNSSDYRQMRKILQQVVSGYNPQCDIVDEIETIHEREAEVASNVIKILES